MKLTAEQLMKARSAKSAEELMELAKADGIEVTEEQATEQFTMLHSEGVLADEELDNVAGGCGGDEDQDEHWFNPGDRVRVTAGEWKGRTGTSSGMNYTTAGGATCAWVTFDDNGKSVSCNVNYLEHI